MMRAACLLLLLLVTPLLTASAAPAVAGPPVSSPRRDFVSVLTPAKVIPPTASRAAGRASFHLSDDDTELRYRVTVTRIEDVTLVALRQGTSETTGALVAGLFGPRHVGGLTRGLLVEGRLTVEDLTGPLASSASLAALVEAMRRQTVYVDVDTVAYPQGEIRGQVHGDRFGDPHLVGQDG